MCCGKKAKATKTAVAKTNINPTTVNKIPSVIKKAVVNKTIIKR